MKSIELRLQEALDKLSEKDAKAAKKIHERGCTVEAKLAATEALLEGKATVPAWRATEADKLVEEIRESSNVFRPVVRKHNGVLENAPAWYQQVDGKKDDGTKLKLAETARKVFGLTEAESRVFAGLDNPASLATKTLLEED